MVKRHHGIFTTVLTQLQYLSGRWEESGTGRPMRPVAAFRKLGRLRLQASCDNGDKRPFSDLGFCGPAWAEILYLTCSLLEHLRLNQEASPTSSAFIRHEPMFVPGPGRAAGYGLSCHSGWEREWMITSFAYMCFYMPACMLLNIELNLFWIELYFFDFFDWTQVKLFLKEENGP